MNDYGNRETQFRPGHANVMRSWSVSAMYENRKFKVNLQNYDCTDERITFLNINRMLMTEKYRDK